MRRVALVTAASLPAGMEDTPELVSRLRGLGATPTVVQWSDPQIRWDSFHRILLHSPWDYSARFREFTMWLDGFKDDSRLVNSYSLISWNLDKRYLIDLRNRDIVLPATIAEDSGRNFTEAALDELAAGLPLVIKPAVGAGGGRTYRTPSAAEAIRLIRAEMPDEPVLVQQYESAIEVMGEYSAVYLGNSASHVVRKMPRAREFRVQSQHGGTVVRESVEPWIEDYARSVIDRLPARPSYARLDFIGDKTGTIKLMEVELAEPDLFLRWHHASYGALADAILKDA
jgi:glutathione synthase/RimK-type ligase-like ATP-grasp enzyme